MSDIAFMIDVTERLLPRKGSPDSAASQLAAFSMMIREAPKFTGQKIPESAGRLVRRLRNFGQRDKLKG